jgi:hypothetical protein
MNHAGIKRARAIERFQHVESCCTQFLPDDRYDAGIAIGNEDSVKGNRPANHVDSNQDLPVFIVDCPILVHDEDARRFRSVHALPIESPFGRVARIRYTTAA